jgi:hypothetical protein
LSQLADEGNLFNNDAAVMDGSFDGGVASTLDQIKSPVAFVAVVAVAICSVFVIVFVTIFTVLQVSWDGHDLSHLIACYISRPLMCHFNDGSTFIGL